MYNEEDLNRLKKETRLSDIASTRIRLKKDGNEWKGLCPFHREKSPSFTIRTGSDGVDLFKCFGCQKSGNIFQFLMEFDKITFDEAVKSVAHFSGWIEPERTKQDAKWESGKKQVDKVFKTVFNEEEKITYPISELKPAEEALENSEAGIKWLDGRGISLSTAKKLHLGYVHSIAAISPNHPYCEQGWIVFPSIEGDRISLLKYRSVVSKKTPDGKPCILRKKGMATPLYNVECINPLEDVFVVEGEPDTAIMVQAGYAAVGFPGAGFTPTPEMRDKLMEAATVYLAGDMDQVGRETMTKLWSELRDRTFLIEWPEGCKDANETFLKVSKGDVTEFRKLVEKLKQNARQKPIPNFYDMNEVMKTADFTDPMKNPNRLHFPWKEVDEMAVCLPGSVVSSFASYTGTGKTTFWLAVQLEEAIKHKAVVINYSAELSPSELARLTAAILLKKDRLQISEEDFKRASNILENARFYVGYNPDVSNIKAILGDDKTPGLLDWAIRRLGPKIVVLDHLHFFTSGEREAISSEAAAMTRIKNLAVKYNLIFIVVGQSRKANQSQKFHVSDGQDAKGSEAFTSTANTTYHLHRDKKRDIDASSPPEDMLDPITSIRLYKVRTKGPGKAFCQLYFKGETGRFEEMIPEPVEI